MRPLIVFACLCACAAFAAPKPSAPAPHVAPPATPAAPPAAKAPEAPAPPDLAPLLDKETELVDTVRRYDLQEKALADWDNQLAQNHENAGEKELAQEKRKRAEQRYATIEALYDQVLKKYPNNARALNYYGEVLYDFRGNETKALESWKMASVIDPKLPEPLNNLGIHYCHTGEYVEGFRCFDEALKLDPDNPDFLFNVAQNYLIYRKQIGEIKKWSMEKVYSEAMKLSKRAAELAPKNYELAQDYAVNFFAAEDFGVKADWREAASAWAKARALAIYPDRVFYTWLNEARAWKRVPNKEKALQCLMEARVLQPESAVVKNLITEVDNYTPVRESGAKEPKTKTKTH